MLRKVFYDLCAHYTADQQLADSLWQEIENHYTEKGRHYHTLSHLENLYGELEPYKDIVEDWDTLLFSLFYHDIIYKATNSDNEEQSAELAKKRLEALGMEPERIEKCAGQILATKSHSRSKDKDTNLFTDADLSILGQPTDIYDKYAADVRKEYKIYPDLLYKPGRKKVLKHFLAMERIYKTEEFYGKYELAAKGNLERELGIW